MQIRANIGIFFFFFLLQFFLLLLLLLLLFALLALYIFIICRSLLWQVRRKGLQRICIESYIQDPAIR